MPNLYGDMSAISCNNALNHDISIVIVKYFRRIMEKRSLEFRTEMFNAPNHVELNAGAS